MSCVFARVEASSVGVRARLDEARHVLDPVPPRLSEARAQPEVQREGKGACGDEGA